MYTKISLPTIPYILLHIALFFNIIVKIVIQFVSHLDSEEVSESLLLSHYNGIVMIYMLLLLTVILITLVPRIA